MKRGVDSLRGELGSSFRLPSLTRQFLMRARRRSIRRRIWFRALDRGERHIVELTIRCVEKVKSRKLTKVLTRIIGKLSEALKSRFLEKVRRIGVPLAQKVSRWAVSWGNWSALTWAEDPNFARYLAIAESGAGQICRSGS